MATMIPSDVIEHLRELAEAAGNPFAGGITMEQVVEELDVPVGQARKLVRQLVRDGQMYSRRIGMSQETANRLGYLGSGSVPVYFWRHQ